MADNILTESAIEGFKQYTDRTIAYARYRIGATWYKTPITRRERMANGKVAVYFSIIPQASNTVTINRVQLYDTANNVWADKTENITIESVQEGFLYRFTFDLHEEAE